MSTIIKEKVLENTSQVAGDIQEFNHLLGNPRYEIQQAECMSDDFDDEDWIGGSDKDFDSPRWSRCATADSAEEIAGRFASLLNAEYLDEVNNYYRVVNNETREVL